MKRLVCMFVTTVLAVSCGTACKSTADVKNNSKEMLCGGYTEQRKITEKEMEMFRTVTSTGDMVITPISVATQVVAGLNYKFWCSFKNKPDGKTGNCWVVIYQPLQGNPELTKIEVAE